MLIENLNICPCDKSFNNVFWNEFSLCLPKNKACKRSSRGTTSQFPSLNSLKRHCKQTKDVHHQILNRYIHHYEQNRKKSNFLIGQLIDATCSSMKYLLKSTYHSDIFKKRIESMFTVTDVNSDGHCGFSSIVLCLKISMFVMTI